MEAKKKLEIGEKYLSLDIEGLKLALFPNKLKTKENEPDFRGVIPIACWVNKKKAQAQPSEEL